MAFELTFLLSPVELGEVDDYSIPLNGVRADMELGTKGELRTHIEYAVLTQLRGTFSYAKSLDT